MYAPTGPSARLAIFLPRWTHTPASNRFSGCAPHAAAPSLRLQPWWMPGEPTAQRVGVFVAICVAFALAVAAAVFALVRWRRGRRAARARSGKLGGSQGAAKKKGLKGMFFDEAQEPPQKPTLQLDQWPQWQVSEASPAGAGGCVCRRQPSCSACACDSGTRSLLWPRVPSSCGGGA